MRLVPQNQFFKSYKLSPSRTQWAARRARQAAAAASAPPPIVNGLDELLDLTSEYTDVRRARDAALNADADPELVEADHKVDRSFSNFVGRVEMEVEDHGPQSTRGKAGQRLLDGALNVEVKSVTNANREEEEAMLESILEELRAEHLADIGTCDLDASFQVLQDDYEAFSEAMDEANEGEAIPTAEELRDLKEAIEAKMIEVIHRVNGAHPTTSKADRRARSEILGPFAIQNDRLAAFYKRNSGAGIPPEVDPETGEELDEDDESSDDTREGADERQDRPEPAES